MASVHRRRLLYLVALLTPVAAFLALLTFGAVGEAGAPRVGDKAPEIKEPRLSGDGAVSLSSLRGDPVVVNFWASWCVPCKDEAPLLARAARAYEGKINFLGVNVHDSGPAARRFVAHHHLGYEQVRDEDGSAAAAYGLTGQPETFFLDASGRIVEHVPGEIDPPRLAALLRTLAAGG
jgi:cytochrome c biogenesis protein CcmG/thiol:disulfide interchange protein DsbE